MKFNRWQQATIQETELIEETSALLMGRVMRFYQVRKVPPPTWAYLNWIAHGQSSEIIDRARGARRASAVLREPGHGRPAHSPTKF